MNTSLQRALGVGTLTAAALFAASGIASAHVSVNAPGATQGGYSVLEFRVPTESDTAGTTGLTITLPALKSARPEPIPGWTAVVGKDAQQNATSITWTANPGVSVGPGQFQRFVVSAGPLPEQASLDLPATQTYSDGSVVNWNEPTPAGGAEPEHPTPSLALGADTGGGDDDHAAHGGADPASTNTGSTSTAAPAAKATDNTARVLGGIGLVLGGLGAALGIGAAVRGRQS